MSKRTRRKFEPEFKAEAVRLVMEEGRTVSDVAKSLGIYGSTLGDWVKQAKADQGQSSVGVPTTAELEEIRRLRKEVRELRMEREIFKKGSNVLREGKLMRYEFIHAENVNFPVRTLCRVMEVSASGYYAWVRRKPSKRAVDDRALAADVRAIHAKSRGTYGSPRIHRELLRTRPISRKRVARVMRENGVYGRRPPRFRVTTDSKHRDPIADNVLARDFSATSVDQKWVGDITYVWTGEGWLYLAVLIDLYSRRVVGWAVAEHMRTELAINALNMALGRRRPPRNLMHHTDRGCQYASKQYRAALRFAGVTPSMSRSGDCWDNAVAESFFATIKKELIHRYRWLERRDASKAIGEYIELFYNNHRLHSSIGYRSPAEFEALNSTPQAANIAA